MAVVSHELKSPLHGILGLCNSLLEDDETPFQVKKPLSMMNSCTKRLLDMVSNIMDASLACTHQARLEAALGLEAIASREASATRFESLAYPDRTLKLVD